LWNSDRNPSWNTRVETAGVEEDDASGEAAEAAGLAATVSFFASMASFFALAAASSFDPNSSVKTVSREVLMSATLAHLSNQL
jgi:hypothetical protein